MKAPMGPPPPKFPIPPRPDSSPNPTGEPSSEGATFSDEAENRGHAEAEQAAAPPAAEACEEKEPHEKPAASTSSAQPTPGSHGVAVPYAIPPWSEPPGHPFYIEVLKDGAIIEQLDVFEKGAFMFGRIDLCDFVLEHPTVSRFHAVLQFRNDGEAFLYDLGSTHGTFLNKNQIKKRVYTAVHVGDIIRFGQSSRLYIFQGPSELMPPEGDLKKLRDARIQEEMQDREASLLRASAEASMADGISWGMSEDATEDSRENDAEEVTWQTYKGQLTERQEKTREKILKRMGKVANMRKEIDAIRAKDISQGGLTQGQQTQIARNEQRMSQIMEELESLEETLNESIQESIGARVKVIRGKKKGTQDEDEDEVLSDDDEFYDRTKKKPSLKKPGDQQSVETADTLLDRKDVIIKEMEEKTNLLLEEKAKMLIETKAVSEEGDELDAYMTGLSSQLVLDKSAQISKELSTLQSELDRILYLLRIADPSGEVAQKREAKLLASKSNQADTSCPSIPKEPVPEHTETALREKSSKGHSPPLSLQTEETLVEENERHAQKESEAPLYTATKPQWLGAAKETTPVEDQQEKNILDVNEADQFVDYKDRKNLAPADDGDDIEHAAPGLIIRKRKHVQELELPHNEVPKLSASSSPDAETAAADAVALLLKHKRGYVVPDAEVIDDDKPSKHGEKSGKKKNKRMLGPERPAFLDSGPGPDYESWMPPEGQSGDGRTSLNDRLGY